MTGPEHPNFNKDKGIVIINSPDGFRVVGCDLEHPNSLPAGEIVDLISPDLVTSDFEVPAVDTDISPFGDDYTPLAHK